MIEVMLLSVITGCIAGISFMWFPEFTKKLNRIIRLLEELNANQN